MKGQSPQERAGARLGPLPHQVPHALGEQTARPGPLRRVPGHWARGETKPALPLSRRAGAGGLLARPPAAFLQGLWRGWWTHSQVSARNSWGGLAPSPRQMQLPKARLWLKGPRPGRGEGARPGERRHRHERPFHPERLPGLPPPPADRHHLRLCSQRGSLGRAQDGGPPATVPARSWRSPACSRAPTPAAPAPGERSRGL